MVGPATHTQGQAGKTKTFLVSRCRVLPPPVVVSDSLSALLRSFLRSPARLSLPPRSLLQVSPPTVRSNLNFWHTASPAPCAATLMPTTLKHLLGAKHARRDAALSSSSSLSSPHLRSADLVLLSSSTARQRSLPDHCNHHGRADGARFLSATCSCTTHRPSICHDPPHAPPAVPQPLRRTPTMAVDGAISCAGTCNERSSVSLPMPTSMHGELRCGQEKRFRRQQDDAPLVTSPRYFLLRDRLPLLGVLVQQWRRP
jgi:hypothetical protein